MQKEWLTQKTTRSEAEAAFGFQNGEWLEFIAKMQDGDELWTFTSSDESWEHLCGCAGIALVRRGEIVDSIVTELN
jgi:hypothetical protein